MVFYIFFFLLGFYIFSFISFIFSIQWVFLNIFCLYFKSLAQKIKYYIQFCNNQLTIFFIAKKEEIKSNKRIITNAVQSQLEILSARTLLQNECSGSSLIFHTVE